MKKFIERLFGPRIKSEFESLPTSHVQVEGDSNYKEFALNELDRLAEIITRHEKHAFTVKTFLAAIITGLATVVFSRDPSEAVMTPTEITVVGTGAVITFWAWATAHRLLASKAIRRTRRIEAQLSSGRKAISYDGPSVSQTMAEVTTFSDWRESGFYTTHALPFYIAIVAVVVLTYADIRRIDEQKREDDKSDIADAVIRDAKFPDIKGGDCQAVFKVDHESTKGDKEKFVLDTVSCDMQ